MPSVIYKILNVLESTASTQTFRNTSPKMPVNNESRLTHRTALSSHSSSAFNSPTEKAAKFMI